jgi:hypothetical protein
VERTWELAAGSWTSTYVICPAGTVVTGGGYSASIHSVAALAAFSSYPAGNLWVVDVVNNGDRAWPLTVYAVCATAAV